MYKNLVKEALPKGVPLKTNKTAISQSLAEFVEKKRKVAGMTFSCRLHEMTEVGRLAESTALLINGRLV